MRELELNFQWLRKIWVLGATMIGPARNVIRNRAIHDARNMASARMELACVVKDGTDDIARCVSKILTISIMEDLNLLLWILDPINYGVFLKLKL